MLNTLNNSAFYQSMEFFEEIGNPHEILLREKLINLDVTLETYQDLQEKYSSLHETYAKEIENSNKVKRSLGKCLKLYSKLSKKYEAQQKIIDNLQGNIQQKINCLEESLENQEKMKGLLEVYKCERTLYVDESNIDLRKDKEILLDICCKLISESVRTTNIKHLINLILRRFKKDLSEEKINLLKSKDVVVKKEVKVKSDKASDDTPESQKQVDVSERLVNTERDSFSGSNQELEKINDKDNKVKFLSAKESEKETQEVPIIDNLDIGLPTLLEPIPMLESSSLVPDKIRENNCLKITNTLARKNDKPDQPQHIYSDKSVSGERERNGDHHVSDKGMSICDNAEQCTLPSTTGEVQVMSVSHDGYTDSLEGEITQKLNLGKSNKFGAAKSQVSNEESLNCDSVNSNHKQHPPINQINKNVFDVLPTKANVKNGYHRKTQVTAQTRDTGGDNANQSMFDISSPKNVTPSSYEENRVDSLSCDSLFSSPERQLSTDQQISGRLHNLPAANDSNTYSDKGWTTGKFQLNNPDLGSSQENQSNFDFLSASEGPKDLICERTVLMVNSCSRNHNECLFNKSNTNVDWGKRTKSTFNNSNPENTSSKTQNVCDAPIIPRKISSDNRSAVSYSGSKNDHFKDSSKDAKIHENSLSYDFSFTSDSEGESDEPFATKKGKDLGNLEESCLKLKKLSGNTEKRIMFEVQTSKKNIKTDNCELSYFDETKISGQTKGKSDVGDPQSDCGVVKSETSFSHHKSPNSFNVSKKDNSGVTIETDSSWNNQQTICTRRFNIAFEEKLLKKNKPFTLNSHEQITFNEDNLRLNNPLTYTGKHQNSSVCAQSIFDIPTSPKERCTDMSRILRDQYSSLDVTFDAPKDKGHFSDLFFDLNAQSLEKISNKNLSNSEDLIGKVEDPEEKLTRIFKEMSTVRLLSPIRDICVRNQRPPKQFTTKSFVNKTKNPPTCPTQKSCSGESEPGRKREVSDVSCRSKKLKSSTQQDNNCGLLDSIMCAMSVQNEEFKSTKKVVGEKEYQIPLGFSERCASEPCVRIARNGATEELKQNGREKEVDEHHTRRKSKDNTLALEKMVMEEIKRFVSCSISSKEEADRNVKDCISVLMNKPEEMVARIIVALVFENIDEHVEIFERPAPPLTRTQHRLMALLSVFKNLDASADKISSIILSKITEKLYPDNFFWPDESVETASRFYTALCRTRNDTKNIWKFCLQAMTEMKQRCCLVVFTALKTWPDALHDANTIQNNILAVTIVNIFLHMPKTDGLRNFNQKKKLMALKHLLMNFYQFKVDDTIEDYTKKVLDALLRDEVGSEKSVALLSKCREWAWSSKNVLPKLKETLVGWSQDKVNDAVGWKALSVIKQVVGKFPMEFEKVTPQEKEMLTCLIGILTSRKMNHATEQSIVEILLDLKQYPEVRKVIREWVPKNPINDTLRNAIINVSSENILRELKMNRRKEAKEKKVREKMKKKKNKGKKKAKKRKLVKVERRDAVSGATCCP